LLTNGVRLHVRVFPSDFLSVTQRFQGIAAPSRLALLLWCPCFLFRRADSRVGGIGENVAQRLQSLQRAPSVPGDRHGAAWAALWPTSTKTGPAHLTARIYLA